MLELWIGIVVRREARKRRRQCMPPTHKREYGFVFGDRVGSRADSISLPDSSGSLSDALIIRAGKRKSGDRRLTKKKSAA
jgi:hypothetical protein